MDRQFAAMQHASVDLLVIGGGIYGAWTAYDAALRGYRVALVDKTDWAAGTSSASSKLIHGGLRYLEHFNFGLVRHGLAERATLTRIAPHAVDPIRFVIPKYEGDRVASWKMRIGLALYDLLAGRGQPVAPHDRFDALELRDSFPYLSTEGLIGGFSYGDCQEDDARVTLEVVAAAQRAGAMVANHTAVSEVLYMGDRVIGARIEDRLGGGTGQIRARLTVNAAGPWAPDLAGGRSVVGDYKLIKGVHLMMPELPGPKDAFLLTARSDGRVFFVIPWYDHTIIGTTESDYQGDPKDLAVYEDEAEYLLDEANRALRQANWRREDIRGCFAGVRTLMGGSDGSLSAVSRDFMVRKAKPGLWMPIGGKYTTARGDAESIVDMARAELGPARGTRRTDQQPLAWAPSGDVGQWRAEAEADARALGVDERAAAWLVKRHGTQTEAVLDMVRTEPSLAMRLHEQCPFIRAEVAYAARHEMARSLVDVLRRRLPVMLMLAPDQELARNAAHLMAPELDWDDTTIEAQCDAALALWPGISPRN
ncbi:glycerol-3-phosphate dehydrogenase/oxidase [Abyssibacter profundi]|uniref:Glycerol-3-phosphate dehydrogenase/oxidase n=1 Tax=Abyssibacter profundi TaxID=2182787 RepID=A0A383XR13_9GAMM|nr:glycerol-3-phosphate dehydrogenase/oxidase [Abyssibacter profundi]MBV62080.1 hypothetical protein [Nevskiales bacterium]PWN55067.1 glycerol-3-phosphate dehydrogenase/oxidase [Abyssibacter profundi]